MIVGSKNLPTLRAAAHAAIDAAAETCRLTFVTGGAAQAMVYVQKAAEANRFLAAYPDSTTAPTGASTDWPWTSAELGITAPTMWQVAEVISQLANKFVTAGSTIENLRMGAKDAVSAATSAAGIGAAQVVTTWPTAPQNLPST